MTARTWCNRNPVGTRCEVLISKTWRVGYIGGFSPDHIRIRVAGRRDVVLTEDQHDRFRALDYTAGLRRAQELARDPAVSYQRRGSFAEIDLNAFDRAIDAEAAKERT